MRACAIGYRAGSPNVVREVFVLMGMDCALGWALKAPSSSSSEEPRHGLLMSLLHPSQHADVHRVGSSDDLGRALQVLKP
jgi:hypothetical protein